MRKCVKTALKITVWVAVILLVFWGCQTAKKNAEEARRERRWNELMAQSNAIKERFEWNQRLENCEYFLADCKLHYTVKQPTVSAQDLVEYTTDVLEKDGFGTVTLLNEIEGIGACRGCKVVDSLEEQVHYWVCTFSTDQHGVTVRLVVDGSDQLVVGYLR